MYKGKFEKSNTTTTKNIVAAILVASVVMACNLVVATANAKSKPEEPTASVCEKQEFDQVQKTEEVPQVVTGNPVKVIKVTIEEELDLCIQPDAYAGIKVPV